MVEGVADVGDRRRRTGGGRMRARPRRDEEDVETGKYEALGDDRSAESPLVVGIIAHEVSV